MPARASPRRAWACRDSCLDGRRRASSAEASVETSQVGRDAAARRTTQHAARNIQVDYGSGKVTGYDARDAVLLGSGLRLEGVAFGEVVYEDRDIPGRDAIVFDVTSTCVLDEGPRNSMRDSRVRTVGLETFQSM